MILKNTDYCGGFQIKIALIKNADTFLQEKSNSSILFPYSFWDYICILFSSLFSFSAMRVRLREF